MKCPNDDTVLQMTDRQGVEIDYCPTCRGVWLDRGELDKILERSRSESREVERPAASAPQGAAQPGYPPQGYRRDDDDDDDEDDRRRNPRGYDQSQQGYPAQGGYPPKKKKRGFLEDLLDFG